MRFHHLHGHACHERHAAPPLPYTRLTLSPDYRRQQLTAGLTLRLDHAHEGDATRCTLFIYLRLNATFFARELKRHAHAADTVIACRVSALLVAMHVIMNSAIAMPRWTRSRAEGLSADVMMAPLIDHY